ncbi:MAG: hypothetical protein LBI61_01475, partial [Puniceicoccales bacterium]|nr:hypothetical protein [Puniceicoccales bacterium]
METVKKGCSLALLLSCLGASGLFGDFGDTISDTRTDAAEWADTATLFADSVDDPETPTADTHGALNIACDSSGSVLAAATAKKEVHLFFTNVPSVATPVLTGSDVDTYLAHVYAKSTDEVSAIGIQTLKDATEGTIYPVLTLNTAGLPDDATFPKLYDGDSGTKDGPTDLLPYAIVANYDTTSATGAGAATVIGDSQTAAITGAESVSVDVTNLKVDLGSGTGVNSNILVAHGGMYVNGGTYNGSATNVIGASLSLSGTAGAENYAAKVSSTQHNLADSGWTDSKDWKIGNYNTLIAISDGPGSDESDAAYASANCAGVANVLGASLNSNAVGAGFSSDNENTAEVSTTYWEIGDNNTMEASAGGYNRSTDYYYGGTASILGASCNVGGPSGSAGGNSHAHVDNLKLDIGNNNTLTARGSSSSVVVGAAGNSINSLGRAKVDGSYQSSEDKLNTPWTIGDSNTMKAYSGCAASVMGVSLNGGGAYTDALAVVDGGEIKIAGENTLGAYSAYAATVLGVSYESGSAGPKAVVKNVDWTLGDKNILTASSCVCSTVLGASLHDNASFGSTGSASAQDSTWNIGVNNRLTACSMNVTGDDPGYLLYETKPRAHVPADTIAAVLGASTSTSAIGSETTAIMQGVTINLAPGNALTASSVAGAGKSAVATAIGSGAHTNIIANDMVVNINGSQTIAAMAYGGADSDVYTFGANNTDAAGEPGKGWRVGIAADGVADGYADGVADSATVVNILGARLNGEWDIDGGATATLGENQGKELDRTAYKIKYDNDVELDFDDMPAFTQGLPLDNYAKAFALGTDFQIHIGGKWNPNANAGAGEFVPVESDGDRANVVNVVGAICRGRGSYHNFNEENGNEVAVENVNFVREYRLNTSDLLGPDPIYKMDGGNYLNEHGEIAENEGEYVKIGEYYTYDGRAGDGKTGTDLAEAIRAAVMLPTEKKYPIGCVPGTALTVSNGWTVNAFGPVLDFEKITVNGGTVNLYSHGKNNKVIEIVNGSLHVGQDTSGKFDNVVEAIAGRISYVDPATGVTHEGAVHDGEVVIDVGSYPWKGSGGNSDNNERGRLSVATGETLVIHVDSSKPDPAFAGTIFADKFRKVNGFVTFDPGHHCVRFSEGYASGNNAGQIAIVDDAEEHNGLPPDTKYWIIRSTDTTEEYGYGDDPNPANLSSFLISGGSGVEEVKNGDYGRVKRVFAKDPNGISNHDKFFNSGGEYVDVGDHTVFISDENLNVVNGETEGFVYIKPDGAVGEIGDGVSKAYALGRGIYLSTDYIESESGLDIPPPDSRPPSPLPGPVGASNPNGSRWAAMAPSLWSSVSIVRDSMQNHLVIDGSQSGDPFVHVVGSYTDQGVVDGCGYTNKIVGILAGLDYTHRIGSGNVEDPMAGVKDPKKDEKYVRAGLIFSYLRGRTNFAGDIAERERTAKENMYVGAMFAAYQSFNDSGKKTDANMFAGCEHAA